MALRAARTRSLFALLACAISFAAAAASAQAALVAESPPGVRGKAMDGRRLKAATGKWSGAGPISYSYVWKRCDATGAGCAPIEGATAATYTATPADVGHRLLVLVTATGGEGSAEAASAPSAAIGPAAPKHKGAVPAVAGNAQDGQLLSATAGGWKGTTPMSFAYQWQSCTGSKCTAIAGATQSTFRPSSEEAGRKLRVLVTASNAGGSASKPSKKTAAIAPGPPVNTGLPAAAGLPVVEQTLTAEPGVWAGTGPFTYTYQWRGCNLLGECEDISGAHDATYKVGPLQIANSIEVVVTAHNALGSSSATSEPTSLISALLPKNLGLPSITGLLQDGGLLSALTGSWEGSEPLDFSYAWELCDAAGLECEQLEGALGTTLGLLSSAVGRTVRVIVTATNSAGSSSATSEPTSLVKALLPSNSGLPSITGLLQDGGLLSALTGSWTGTGPLSYAFQWERCDAAGTECEPISGETGSTLKLLTGLIGSTVRVAVTATGAGGSSTVTSPASGLVKALLPSNIGLPSIGGLLEDGQTLTGAKGSWSGSSPSFSYQWLLCNGGGSECKEVSGATGATLGLLTSMIGKTVRLAVTATNSAGATTATSEPSSAILAILPKVLSLPSIAGLAEDGQTLTGATGSWEGSEPGFSYQWKSCNAGGSECTPVSKATATTLALTEGLIGRTLRLAVTATNSRGSSTAESAATSSVLAILPFKATAPSIAGILQVGKILEVVPNGEWGGSEKPKAKWQWQTCGLLGLESDCTDLAGAIAKTLKLELGWLGLTIRVVESATNSRGTVTKKSPITSTILGLLLTPNQGSTEGGTAVKLSAAGVGKASAVRFGSVQTSEIEVDSPNQITVTSPPGTEGTVSVTVSTPEGTTHETPETQFTYTGE